MTESKFSRNDDLNTDLSGGKNFTRIEKSNRALCDGVRYNMGKIDRIVKSIANVSRATVRDQSSPRIAFAAEQKKKKSNKRHSSVESRISQG